MGARWLYMLPALMLSVVAVILALVGLARDPSPAKPERAGADEALAQQRAADKPKYTYWVATRELNIGSIVADDDFQKIDVSAPLSSALQADAQVVGQRLFQHVRNGEILTQVHLEAGNRLAQSVPAQFRAFAIDIDNASAVGGLLEPGDLVDVLVHFRKGQDEQPTSMILLKAIEVLAVKGQLQDADKTDEEKEKSRSRNATAVLAIPREALPKLLLADSNGELRLAMAGEDIGSEQNESAGGGAVGLSGKEQKELMLTTKLDSLFPEKKPVRRSVAPPRGNKVEVYEGSTSRSTYVR
ncbi:hypothetical protein Y017_05275 [Alcanivorax sp. 97CO-5]|jgi:pilus assembly protein CpaB|nr:hypothetical protein Y017_05275 [Alcanivorax sp. 97CO-5]PKG00707.1 Flp pilus assembly protein CpaB [Alcanivorax sp. 97CO-6]